MRDPTGVLRPATVAAAPTAAPAPLVVPAPAATTSTLEQFKAFCDEAVREALRAQQQQPKVPPTPPLPQQQEPQTAPPPPGSHAPPPASPVHPRVESPTEQDNGDLGGFEFEGDSGGQGFSQDEFGLLSQDLPPPPPSGGSSSSRRPSPYSGKKMPEDVASLKKRLDMPGSPERKRKSSDKKSSRHGRHREHRESDTSRSSRKRRHEVSPPVQRTSPPSVAKTPKPVAPAAASASASSLATPETQSSITHRPRRSAAIAADTSRRTARVPAGRKLTAEGEEPTESMEEE